MLFNSIDFLFAFLPITLAGYQLAGRFGRRAVIGWLAFMSLVFYGVWRPEFLLLLGGSVLFNFGCARLIKRFREDERWGGRLLFLGVAGNLLLLGYYKYLFPALSALGRLLLLHHQFAGVLLPLGISFFTFTQIAYLVDLRQGAAELQDFPSYVLFVTFFPHLIAGPILHHSEIMPQFAREGSFRLRGEDVSVGLTLFVMGLFKKVMIADTIAPFADQAFANPRALAAVPAWLGVLCYTMQLYFDFSGYSDMAIGLARIFSIRFPLNFDSPYKAGNIIDFWSRWHMTLTRYVTLYLYNPISLWVNRRRLAKGKKVSRKGSATIEGFTSMIAFPTLVSMGIIGIWHGAGLQFLLFGLAHGIYLTVNHGWRVFRGKRDAAPAGKSAALPASWLLHAGSVLLTMLCVVVAQVLFRANSTRDAFAMFGSMAALHGLGSKLPPAATLVLRVRLPLLFLIVWFLPNTQQMLALYHPADGVRAFELPWRSRPALPTSTSPQANPPLKTRPWLWRPTLGWAIIIAGALLVSITFVEDTSRFLYFQF